MKLVHWLLMGGLLHLIQRGGEWVGPQPTQASSGGYWRHFYLDSEATVQRELFLSAPNSPVSPTIQLDRQQWWPSLHSSMCQTHDDDDWHPRYCTWQQNHKSGTVCRPITDYVGCHTASSGGYWRHFYLDSETTVQHELFLTAPNRNILTYLLTTYSAPDNESLADITDMTYSCVQVLELSVQFTYPLIKQLLLHRPLRLRSTQHWVLVTESLHLALADTLLHHTHHSLSPHQFISQ